MSIEGPLVYLARHGETEWNLQRRRQGQLDSPLSHGGQRQAQQLATLLAGEGIDAIFASPLGRATTTAQIIAGALDQPVVILDELAEVHHGDFAGRTNDEIRAASPGALEARAVDKYRWRFPGGESYADADERAGRVLARIESTGAHRVLIVSHDMIGRMLLRNLLALSPQDALARTHPHDVVYRIETATRQLTTLTLPPGPTGGGQQAAGAELRSRRLCGPYQGSSGDLDREEDCHELCVAKVTATGSGRA